MVRRIETSRPGELVHIDIKKQAKIPPGGGWRVKRKNRANPQRQSRPTTPRLCLRPLGNRRVLAAGVLRGSCRRNSHHGGDLWKRARAFFASYGITVERVMTDNGPCYRSRAFDAELVAAAIVHTRIKPYCPQTNGKVERYNRTLLNEWAYARPYRSEAARTRARDKWLHMYNYHRHHAAIGEHQSAASIT